MVDSAVGRTGEGGSKSTTGSVVEQEGERGRRVNAGFNEIINGEVRGLERSSVEYI